MYEDFILDNDKVAKNLEKEIISSLIGNGFSLSKSRALFDKIIIRLETTPLNEL